MPHNAVPNQGKPMITTMILRILVVVLALGFLFVAYTGFFRPDRLAEALFLAPQSLAGLGSIRALVGAQYLAMGLVSIYAVLRGQWAWLAPLAAIEGCMIVARVMSLTGGEAGPTATATLGMEIFATLVLALAAILPPRLSR